jgi:hypothetical protein
MTFIYIGIIITIMLGSIAAIAVMTKELIAVNKEIAFYRKKA